jgi:hypothetical protein
MNDSTMKSQVQAFLKYVLDNQDSTGWLGPEVGTSKPRYLVSGLLRLSSNI